MSPTLRIASALLMLAALAAQAQTAEPRLDLDKSVENPALVRAMDQLASDPSEGARDQLLGELQHAEFLAAILPDDGKNLFAGPPGATIVSKGKTFGALAAGKDGKTWLLLFTDWAQLRTYTGKNVSGWVLPAHDAWAFALQKGFDGVVVNPAHNALPLQHAMVQYLATQLASELRRRRVTGRGRRVEQERRSMPETIHSFHESHRAAMEAEMRQRVALAAPLLRERAHLHDVDEIGQAVMAVRAQMPHVGGAAARMSDFFMRLLGFMAISRVLRRHGVPLHVIGDIERDTCKAQLLAVPEAQRLASGRHYLSPENQALLREQAAASHRQELAKDFVEPGPGEDFEFGIDYKACGFCKFAARHGDQEILPNLCGLDFDAYAARGIRLVRTQTLAGGATHCDFRFSRLPTGDDDAA